jgi:hypothetical protein
VSEAGEPHDPRDWFRGRPAEARGPRAVAEAFGHLPKETADEASDWFSAAHGSEAAELIEAPAASAPERPPAAPAASAFADFASAKPAAVQQVPVAAAPAELAETETGTETGTEVEPVAAAPAPENDSRVRLRALTGGLADLSDALAAIGVESVALRSTGPGAPPAAPTAAPAPVADFRVRCPDCGPQYVAIADVRFVETGDGADANRYLFTCPACGARVRRPAGPELAEILKSAGVATLALRRGPGQAL